jgi:hypothetical protein
MRLRSSEILTAIGAGGMGEVYRASDTLDFGLLEGGQSCPQPAFSRLSRLSAGFVSRKGYQIAARPASGLNRLGLDPD